MLDASAVVALLTDHGEAGRWVVAELEGVRSLHGPSLLGFEVANVLRRLELRGALTTAEATQARGDFEDLPIEAWPYEVLAARCWELRANLTAYDAAYVAVAERVGGHVLTLDQRLARAPGPACPINAFAGPAPPGG